MKSPLRNASRVHPNQPADDKGAQLDTLSSPVDYRIAHPPSFSRGGCSAAAAVRSFVLEDNPRNHTCTFFTSSRFLGPIQQQPPPVCTNPRSLGTQTSHHPEAAKPSNDQATTIENNEPIFTSYFPVRCSHGNGPDLISPRIRAG